jgi:hypothetical protein
MEASHPGYHSVKDKDGNLAVERLQLSSSFIIVLQFKGGKIPERKIDFLP